MASPTHGELCRCPGQTANTPRKIEQTPLHAYRAALNSSTQLRHSRAGRAQDTLIRPPHVSASVSWPALLKVLAVMLVITAAYRLFTLAVSFLKFRAPWRGGGCGQKRNRARRDSEGHRADGQNVDDWPCLRLTILVLPYVAVVGLVRLLITSTSTPPISMRVYCTVSDYCIYSGV